MTLDLTKPIWAKDRSVVEVLDCGALLHVRLTDIVGIVTHGLYHRDGRSTCPASDGRRDLTNEPPRTGRTTSFGFPRFLEDIA